MRHLVVLALVSFAVINANPISVEDNTIEEIATAKLDLSAVFSKKIDQNVINAIILALNKQGVVLDNTDASENQDDKVTLMKKMLKRKINLPQALSATQDESSSTVKVDIKKKLESKIAQLKGKLPENFKLSENFDYENFKLPTKLETLKETEPVQERKSFKIPANVQLPNKFARKFKVAEKFETEEAQKPEASTERLQRKIAHLKTMMKSETPKIQKDFKIPENLPDKLKQKLSYKLQM